MNAWPTPPAPTGRLEQVARGEQLPTAVMPNTLIAGAPEMVIAVSSLAFEASMQPGVKPMLLKIVKSPVMDTTHAGVLVFTNATACVVRVGSILVNKDAI